MKCVGLKIVLKYCNIKSELSGSDMDQDRAAICVMMPSGEVFMNVYLRGVMVRAYTRGAREPGFRDILDRLQHIKLK